jgi:tryptophan-rich sensory protein
MYNKTWYKNLNQSSLTPPNYVFGIVWPFLYFLMFTALLLVWTNNKCYPYCFPITLFVIHLFFNLIWTTLFFKWKMIRLALFDLIMVLLLAFVTFLHFYNINKKAGYLFIPYLLWLSFALYLNIHIVLNN